MQKRRSSLLVSFETPFQCIRPELEAVERILQQQAASEVALAEKVCGYVHQAGGKRLRPALVILSARALHYDKEDPLWAAAAVEMIHAATLLHDDVVDRAQNRRGRPTANALWGTLPAVMAGNLLLSRSFGLLVRHRQLEVLRLLSETMLVMCRGEILQNLNRGNLQMDEETYYTIINSKTAEFLATCCRAGGILALGDGVQRNPEEERMIASLEAYGLNLGMAFQMTDDLLDFIGDSSITGKPVGGDLREGKMTLPLILAFTLANHQQREEIQRIARKSSISEEDFTRVLRVMEATGAIEKVRSAARNCALQGVREIENLPEGPAKEALIQLALGLAERTQ